MGDVGHAGHPRAGDPDTLLLLYDRMTDDGTYGGQTRVFARRIMLRNERRERAEPLPLPR